MCLAFAEFLSIFHVYNNLCQSQTLAFVYDYSPCQHQWKLHSTDLCSNFVLFWYIPLWRSTVTAFEYFVLYFLDFFAFSPTLILSNSTKIVEITPLWFLINAFTVPVTPLTSPWSTFTFTIMINRAPTASLSVVSRPPVSVRLFDDGNLDRSTAPVVSYLSSLAFDTICSSSVAISLNFVSLCSLTSLLNANTWSALLGYNGLSVHIFLNSSVAMSSSSQSPVRIRPSTFANNKLSFCLIISFNSYNTNSSKKIEPDPCMFAMGSFTGL